MQFRGSHEKKEYLVKMVEICDDRKARQWHDICRQELFPHDYLQLLIKEGELRQSLSFLLTLPSMARNSIWGWMRGRADEATDGRVPGRGLRDVLGEMREPLLEARQKLLRAVSFSRRLRASA